jgi:catechol 2,3-dioxygenase-like lactoylglutathione lyase family enzyme
MKIGSVVIDCNDLSAMLAFWQQALRYVPREQPEDDWAVLRDPEGIGVNVSLQQVPEKRVGKNRLHFDLYADDQAGEVERLLGLGATRHRRTPEPGEDFVVLEDPEGNLFCVIDAGEDQNASGSSPPALDHQAEAHGA